jgi:inorganic pyrophosphatase
LKIAGNKGKIKASYQNRGEIVSVNNIGSGKNAPTVVNVIIEIPENGHPVKYEIDKETGLLHVDRFLSTPMVYPCNYGYVPATLSDDGDPIDVLVVAPYPLLSMSVISVRPIGMLAMEDEKGMDYKIVAVPTSDISELYDDVNEPSDLPKVLLNKIEHFFEHYKDLEKGKWVKISGWESKDAACEAIQQSIDNY